MFSLASVREGKDDANTIIYSGDVIWVRKAAPVYIHGEVVLHKVFISRKMIDVLTEAIANRRRSSRGKNQGHQIIALKANSKDREIIAVNYDLIKKGQQKDVMLEPYDIVEVDKAKESIGKAILNIAIGAAKTTVSGFSSGVSYRVLY